MPRAPVIALSHGGGPMPLLGDPMHESINKSLTTRVPKILKLGTPDAPRAIVLVTAHWTTERPTISNGTSHKLLYDYYGFPPEAYRLNYPAPGSPEVASELAEALRGEDFKVDFDPKRGWDHGVFVPMLLINPSANVPIVQLSVLESESPTQHFAMGRALQRLRDRNIAIVGSGFATIHNLRNMLGGGMSSPSFVARNREWSKVLGEAVAEEDEAVREKRLSGWRAFPNSYDMHPKNGAEHFMPLLVCAGAGGNSKAKSYSDDFGGLKIWSYYWD